VLNREIAAREDLMIRYTEAPTERYNLLGAYQDADGNPAASIILDDTLRTLAQDAHDGHWALSEAAEGSGWLEVVVARLVDGRLWTIAQTAKSAVFFRHENGKLVKDHEDRNPHTRLRVAYTPAAGARQPYVFMVDRDGDLVQFTFDDTKWKKTKYDFDGKLKDRPYAAVPLGPHETEIGYGDGDTLHRVELKSGKKGKTHTSKLDCKYLTVWGGFVDSATATGFLCVASGESVPTARQYRNGTWTDLGVAADWLTVSVDDAGLMRVYLEDSLLRQTGWDSTGPVWAEADGVPTAIR
jgi:hypothetical protein